MIFSLIGINAPKATVFGAEKAFELTGILVCEIVLSQTSPQPQTNDQIQEPCFGTKPHP
ncbi:hypothetical protein R69749_04512 [Paraburkholderia domus]|nr:hypothetical protein R70006_05582 [Paraburkholderia domus]CAE6842274.1 hypothetical protein R69749_04512 [Paraburkholderia domus]